ncbi:hypothetical protein VTN02DRAFT_6502 [Thermoascus thermophilus]
MSHPPSDEKGPDLGVDGENTSLPEAASSSSSELPSECVSKTAIIPPSAPLGAVGAIPDVEKNGEVNPPQDAPPPPYSVFSTKMKIFIIVMSAISTLFSPMTSFIYLPALDKLADYYHTSVAKINFSVTTYMIMQGLAPMFFGDLADQIGRRPVYILTLTVYLLANVALALQGNYAALLVLRALQSTGSSGTVALGNAVMADIATSAERSGYIGYVQAGAMFGPALAPTIGGILTQYLGWRAIFWFLVIASGIYLAAYAALLPETCRKIVGNGSVPPRGWNKSLMDIIRGPERHRGGANDCQEQLEGQLTRSTKIRFPNPLSALRIIVEKDVAIVMLFAPFSIGSGIGSILAGRFLDFNFKKVARQIGHPIDQRRGDALRKFPIEKRQAHLAVPLILLFISGFTISGAMTMQQTLLIDLYPQSPATVTAAQNLCRCLLSAAGTSVIQYVIDGIGLGWAYTLVGLVTMAFIPTLFPLLKWGPEWREERFLRSERKKEQAQRKE